MSDPRESGAETGSPNEPLWEIDGLIDRYYIAVIRAYNAPDDLEQELRIERAAARRVLESRMLMQGEEIERLQQELAETREELMGYVRDG